MPQDNKKEFSQFESIKKGLQEAIDYENGIGEPPIVCIISTDPVPDFDASKIREIRNALGMTQVAFASYFGVSSKTVEAWERGTNKPGGPARRVLALIEKWELSN